MLSGDSQAFRLATLDAWSAGVKEHRSIFDACVACDPAAAAERLARHYAHVVLTLIARVVPEHEPTVVRTALRMVVETNSIDDHPISRQTNNGLSGFGTISKKTKSTHILLIRLSFFIGDHVYVDAEFRRSGNNFLRSIKEFKLEALV